MIGQSPVRASALSLSKNERKITKNANPHSPDPTHHPRHRFNQQPAQPMNSFWIALFVILLALASVGVYNLLVRRRNAVDNAFAGIDTQLMMRYDLIPNLVAVVKRYAAHENETLRGLTELRSQANADGLGTNERVRLDNRINQSIGRILALMEKYPDLKAAESFQQLQRALNEVEERIAASRRAFNAAATEYNNSVELFPLNLIAAAFGFTPRTLFSSAEDARANVSVAAAMNN